jgi:hypothetical protein
MESCFPISRLVYASSWSITTFVNENQRGYSADKQYLIRQQDTDLFGALVLADSCMCGAFGLSGAGAGWENLLFGHRRARFVM